MNILLLSRIFPLFVFGENLKSRLFCFLENLEGSVVGESAAPTPPPQGTPPQTAPPDVGQHNTALTSCPSVFRTALIYNQYGTFKATLHFLPTSENNNIYCSILTNTLLVILATSSGVLTSQIRVVVLYLCCVYWYVFIDTLSIYFVYII